MATSDLQRRESALRRNRENRGRMASASTTFYTVGDGVVEFDKRVDFGLIFIEKPVVHYGSEADADDVRDALGLTDADDLPLPNLSGAVTAWDQDENDYYVGCWCAVRVATDVPADTIPITHHFNFMGIALKVIPMDPTD